MPESVLQTLHCTAEVVWKAGDHQLAWKQRRGTYAQQSISGEISLY